MNELERGLMTKKTPNTHPVIAIDLDGTIWKEEYPDCSVPFDGAIECINDMIRSGYEVIIWTARGGDNLNTVKRALIDEYGLNPNVKFNEHSNWFTSIYPIASPKVNASVYFDDKAYGAPDYSNPETWATIRKEYL